ncbi:MAG: hypothetical protein OEM26_08755 [Saprospiraceae bacterium]|nr:hypothetical protein [Saprospiraceae bacterium]
MKQHLKRNWFWYGLILTLSAVSLYFNLKKEVEVKEIEKKLETERIEWRDAIAQARFQVASEHLHYVGKTFSWAVRGNILRKNLDEASQIIEQMVKEPRIKVVDYIEKNGRIKLSSDKKREGQRYREYYPKNTTEREYVFVDQQVQSWIISAPVMSLSKRVGTIVFSYDYKAHPMEGPSQEENDSISINQ